MWTSYSHRPVALLCLVLAALLVVAPFASAQTSPPPAMAPPAVSTVPAAEPDTSVRSLIALFINTTGTLAVVQVLKTYVMPGITQVYPALLPILAGLMGPFLALVQTRLAKALGYPIDLSMIVAIFSGAASVGVNQFVKHTAVPASRIRKLIG